MPSSFELTPFEVFDLTERVKSEKKSHRIDIEITFTSRDKKKKNEENDLLYSVSLDDNTMTKNGVNNSIIRIRFDGNFSRFMPHIIALIIT